MGTSGFLLNLLIFFIAGYITWRMKPKDPKTAVATWLGWVLSFLLLRFTLATWLPELFLNTQEQTAANWDPIYDQAAGTVQGAGDMVSNIIGIGADDIGVSLTDSVSVTTPDYIPDNLQESDFPEALPPAGGGGPIPGAGGWTGAEGTTSTDGKVGGATAVPAATLSVTMTQKIELYHQLTQAALHGDRAAGSAAVASLLALDPADTTARQAEADIAAAAARLSELQALANIQRSVLINQQQESYIRGLLAGGSYYVVASGAEVTNVACQERAIVQVTSDGWLKNSQFQMPRCYLSQFRAKDTGDRFTVR